MANLNIIGAGQDTAHRVPKKYQVIYADPPWSYSCKKPTASPGGAKGGGYSSGVNYYYDTMNIQEIKSMPIQSISENNSVCFIWAVNPMLPEAIETLEHWGFKYKTTITWHKQRCKGMGYWFRGHTEFLLFGVKGNITAFRSLQHNIVSAPVEKHSKKPDCFRSIIDRVTVGMEKIELFARQKSYGWDSWGNEIKGGSNVVLC